MHPLLYPLIYILAGFLASVIQALLIRIEATAMASFGALIYAAITIIGKLPKVDWWRYFYTPREVLYPSYECEDCISMREHGCYCAYLGAWGPGVKEPPLWVELFRIFFKKPGTIYFDRGAN